MNAFEAEAGENIFSAVKRCCQLLYIQGISFGYLTFNGIRIMFSVGSNPDDIVTIYNLKTRLRQLGQEV
jgi:hypothetical protein